MPSTLSTERTETLREYFGRGKRKMKAADCEMAKALEEGEWAGVNLIVVRVALHH
tara:strand:- start:245 stop:409 length:165 start_codon:yes stop_codon:yes gene_type:complete